MQTILIPALPVILFAILSLTVAVAFPWLMRLIVTDHGSAAALEAESEESTGTEKKADHAARRARWDPQRLLSAAQRIVLLAAIVLLIPWAVASGGDSLGSGASAVAGGLVLLVGIGLIHRRYRTMGRRPASGPPDRSRPTALS